MVKRNSVDAKWSSWPVYILAGLVTFLVVGAMGYSLLRGNHVAIKYESLIDASVMLRLETTKAHLWLEELIFGDENESVEKIETLLDKSEWYSQAMLNGGMDGAEIFIAVTDHGIRKKVKALQSTQAQFYDLFKQRYASREKDFVGSDLDQRFDVFFMDFLAQAEAIEFSLREQMIRELSDIKSIQILLIMVIVGLSFVTVVVFHLLNRRRMMDFFQVKKSNVLLEKEIAERKRVEEEMRLHGKIMENITDGFFLIGVDDGIIKYANLTFETMFGYGPGELVGRPVSTINASTEKTPEETKEQIFDILLRTGEWHGEVNNIKKDGTRFWCSANVSTFDHPTFGKVFISTHTDITERKQAKESLLESQKLLDTFFINSPVGLAIVDDQFRYSKINESLASVNGLTVAEHIGRTPRQLMPELASTIEPMFQKVLTEGKEYFDVEISGETPAKPGVLRHWMVSYFPIKAFGGSIKAIGVVLTETTAQKRAEVELRKLSVAVEQSPAMVLITDTKGTIQYVNPRFTETTGYSAAEVLGQNPRLLKSGKMSLNAYRSMWKTIHSGKTWRGEFRNKKKDGSLYWEAASISPIRNAADKITHFLAVKEDITERKEAENELRETNLYLELATARANEMASQAEMANIAKSDFLANMSHEIRTPMNAIIGFSDILADENLTEEQADFVNTIRQSGKNLLAIINDILDFSKIESGKLDTEKIECSLESLLGNVSAMLRPKSVEKGLDFNILRQSELPVTIYTDPTRVSQCLTNLISNAIKFTETGHVHVLVSLEQRAGQPFICFDIEDTGIGIPASKQQAIFESFSQADGSTTRKFGGTGLGLTITKCLAKLLGGSVSVQSQPGKGSVFSLRIPTGVDVASQPFLSEDKLKAPEKPSSPTASQGYTGHILVAEDNSTNQKLIELLLTKMGLNITVVADGQQAVDAATTQPFDMIFMDMQMPVMGGHEAVGILREKGMTLPIVALTGNAMAGDEQECLDAGCDGYIAKPIDRNKLNAMLGKYLPADFPCVAQPGHADSD